MNTDNLILRETDNLPLINKDDTLTNAEIDGNFINIYNDFLSLSQANDPTLTYDVERSYLVDEFATYNGRLWVATDVSTGVTPIDGSAEWNDVFPTVLAHEKNKDTILDEGGTNETTVAEIRAFIDAGLTSTTNLSLSTKTGTSFKIESSTGTDVTIPQATTIEAGLLNSEDKVKLDNQSGINTGDQTLISLNAEDVDNKVTDFTTINDTLYPTTQAVDTYITAVVPDLVDTFIGGLVAQDLQGVTTEGNTTTDNIAFTGGVGVLFDNTSTLRKGTIDAGYGGAKGIAQICSVGYELKWEAGRLYVMGDGGTTIREVSHNFTTAPSATDDNTKGFIVGSRWILDDGSLYVCTDTTTATAVWVLQTITTADIADSTNKRYVTDANLTVIGNTSGSNTGDQDLSGKVDKVVGKGLSTEDYTTAEKSNVNYLNTVTSNVQDQLNAKVNLNTIIAPGTGTKVTYDAKGLILSSTNITTSDVSGLGTLATQSGTFSGTSSGTNTGDQIISDATITTTDITTNNFTTAKHGFVPKGTNVGNYLKDDGTWGAISAGGLTYFTEAQNTTAPNATVPVDSLTAVTGTTNGDFAIIPKGTGAILAQIPDGTATGGDKRGANAVDFQRLRGSANQVGSGTRSVVSGGYNNRASADSSTVVGGYLNLSSGPYSISGGYQNSASGQSGISIGEGNVNTGQAAICLGSNNATTANFSTSFGSNNTASEQWALASGKSSVASGRWSSVQGLYARDFGVWGRQVYGIYNSAIGDSQKSTLILNKITTGTTPTILAVQDMPADATSQLVLQNNNSIRFKGSIIARQSGSTNTSAWDIDGIIQRGTSAATTTLLISNVNVVQNTPAWGTPALTVNTTIGCLTVTVTGVASTNIKWSCILDTAEVIYA